MSGPWQRVRHDPRGACGRRKVGIGAATPAAPATRRRCRDEEVLSPAKLVHGRRTTGRPAQLKCAHLVAPGAVGHVDFAGGARDAAQPPPVCDRPPFPSSGGAPPRPGRTSPRFSSRMIVGTLKPMTYALPSVGF